MTQTNPSRTGHTVVGVFDEVNQAEQAINDLKIAGFTPDSISVVTKDRTMDVSGTSTEENEAGQGALTGSLGGGTLGAVLGWLLAGGTALIPGIGPVAAAGIFGATVSGALIGGTLGGVTGALAGAGIPADEASEYEEHVKGGRTLVTVNAANGNLLESAMDVFERNNATSTRYYNAGETGAGRTDRTSLNSSAGFTAGPATTGRINNTAPATGMDDFGKAANKGDKSITENATPAVTQPGEDPATVNRTIYAEGKSDIASPEEFARLRTEQASDRLRQQQEENSDRDNRPHVS